MSVQPTQVPREPSAYEASTHIGQQKRDRDVPGHAINKCITEGELEEDPDDERAASGNYVFRWSDGEFRYTVAVDTSIMRACTVYKDPLE